MVPDVLCHCSLAPPVALSLFQTPAAPEAGLVLPTLVSASQRSDPAAFAAVSIILQHREVVGGRSVWRGCCSCAAQQLPTLLPSSELSHSNEDLLEM